MASGTDSCIQHFTPVGALARVQTAVSYQPSAISPQLSALSYQQTARGETSLLGRWSLMVKNER